MKFLNFYFGERGHFHVGSTGSWQQLLKNNAFVILPHMDRSFEMMMILRPLMSEADQKKRLSLVEKIIAGRGSLKKSENFGKKELAYHIRKEAQGIYWLLDLNLEPVVVSELNSKLKMEDDILRFLILRKKVFKKVKEQEAKQENKEIKITKVKKIVPAKTPIKSGKTGAGKKRS